MTSGQWLSYLGRRNVAFFVASTAYGVLALVLLQSGFVFSDVLVTTGIFFILVMSVDLVYGLAGLLSLGHIGFFAIGAYTVAVLAKHVGVPFFGGALIAVTFGVSLGVLLGYAFLNLRGSYFLLGTLAFGLVVQAVLRIWFSVTGGEAGLGGVPRPSIFGFVFQSELAFGILVWTVALVLFWLATNLDRSRIGRILRAIRSDEVSAAAAGIHVSKARINILALSAAYASISGTLFASYNGAVHPDSFSLHSLLELLMMLFVGGEGSIWGGLLGATLMRALPDVAGPLGAAKLLFTGVVFTVIIFAFPRGLAGGIALLVNRLFARPRRERVIDQTAAPSPFDSKVENGKVILSIDGAGRAFGGLRAVDTVSFDVKAGQIKSLIGPNGAGKTTLLNLVGGALSLDLGSIRLNERELKGLRPDQIARLGVQRTFQHERLFTHLTVVENAMIGCEGGSDGSVREFLRCLFACPSTLKDEIEARSTAKTWLQLVGLGDRADDPVSTLPHGQRKLVELARAIAAQPTLLLLDETAAGLNDTEKQQLKALIRRFRAGGIAVVLIEHDTEFVMDLSDEVVVMNFGRKIADGSPESVSRDAAVLEAYLGT